MNNLHFWHILHIMHHVHIMIVMHIVSELGQDKGYTVKYNPLPEGVPEGEAQRNS